MLIITYSINVKLHPWSIDGHISAGHGFFIKTAVGQTLINMTNVEHNWGDGVKMYMDNYTINEFNR